MYNEVKTFNKVIKKNYFKYNVIILVLKPLKNPKKTIRY